MGTAGTHHAPSTDALGRTRSAARGPAHAVLPDPRLQAQAACSVPTWLRWPKACQARGAGGLLSAYLAAVAQGLPDPRLRARAPCSVPIWLRWPSACRARGAGGPGRPGGRDRCSLGPHSGRCARPAPGTLPRRRGRRPWARQAPQAPVLGPARSRPPPDGRVGDMEHQPAAPPARGRPQCVKRRNWELPVCF